MEHTANLQYEEVLPPHDLADFIKYFWHSRSTQNKVYTVLPDGYFDLIVQSENACIKSIELFGLYSTKTDVEVPAGTDFWAITFRPLAAEYILRQSIAPFLNTKQVLANDFWGIDQSSDFHQFIKNITRQIRYVLATGKTLDNRKLQLFQLLFSANNTLPVQNLSARVFWTVRQMNRYFNDRLGLSLKTYQNILRCAATYPDLRNGDLFPRQEFYDQSHFIKAVKKYTGQNPSALYRNENEQILQFITLPNK